MPLNDQTVGESIRRRRERLFWSQTELAGQLTTVGMPMNQNTVSRIEHGERPLRLAEAATFAEVLGVSIDVLIGAAATTTDAYAAGARAERAAMRAFLDSRA